MKLIYGNKMLQINAFYTLHKLVLTLFPIDALLSGDPFRFG